MRRRPAGRLLEAGTQRHVDQGRAHRHNLLQDCKYGLKVLGNGNVTKNVTVKAAAFSESAKEKIEKAGGKAEVL